tara:strand:- start:5285 stop:5842 length:558 start_codon:yes stop_codon:yes gene_type:complete
MREFRYYKEVLEFATQAHGDQKRKYSGLPYISHPVAVQQILRDFYSGASEELIYAALLHDVIEDTIVTEHMLVMALNRIFFNRGLTRRVVKLVIELTDVYTHEAYPDFNRRQRKLLEHDRIARISDDAKLIKFADMIHNTESIVKDDPSFAKLYLKEKNHMLDMIFDGRNSDTAVFFRLYERARY